MHYLTKNPINYKAANSHNKFLLLSASAAFVLMQASNASANPTGADVVSGSATVSNPSANKLVVNQTSDKAIINWKNFDISENEWTQFVQPGSNSVALNRITDGNPTEILGKLTANGKLMVVNPNGVFFGANSTVDAAGLIASTSDISNDDFNAGKLKLTIPGKANASIINKGNITAADGGLVALVAPNVRNDGIIQANLGTVALASAQTASIDMYGDNLYSFALDKETTAAATGAKAAVENNGIISVGGGKVLLTAKVAKGVVDNVINNTGIIEANSAHMEGGTVVLDGGRGKVRVSGKVKASGKTGGKITVTGKDIELSSADINASGTSGGGAVRIGGDYQGGGILAHADTVTVDSSSKIDVSAKDAGNGGSSVIWSDKLTSFDGSILGTGYENGGAAEVSSKGELGYNGFADLHGENGKNGTLLLDPDSLYIGNYTDHFYAGDHFVSTSPIAASLNSGTDVTATALNNISVLANIIWSGSGSLTLNAGQNIQVGSDIKATFDGANTQGAVTLNAGNNVFVNAGISTKRGDITVNGVDMSMSGGTLKSALGNVVINNSGKFASSGADVLSGRSVTLHQNSYGSIQNAINAVGNTGSGGALLQLGNGTYKQDFYVNDNNFTIKGNGAANTIINAAYGFSTVAYVNGGYNVTIADLAINGGQLGVFANNTANFHLFNTDISNAAVAGIKLNNTTSSLISGNTLHNNATGLLDSGSIYAGIYGNSFSGDQSQSGISFNGTRQSLISDGMGIKNNFSGLGNGITLNGGYSLVVANNNFTDVKNGVSGINSAGLKVSGNSFTNSTTPGDTAIHNDGGTNFTATNNDINNFAFGVSEVNSSSSSISNNIFKNISTAGIYVPSGSHVLINGNTMSNFDDVTGIAYGSIGTDLLYRIAGVFTKASQVTISNNNITGAGVGIQASSSSYYPSTNTLVTTGGNDLYITGNKLTNDQFGIMIDTYNNIQIRDNSVSGAYGGINVGGDPSNNVKLSNNTVSDSYFGELFGVANNVEITGDTFTNNNYGFYLSSGLNYLIDGVKMTGNGNPGSFGITSIGAENVVLKNTSISGFDWGFYITAQDGSIQFSGNGNSISGVNKYFVLEQNGLFGKTVNASSVVFDGTRASDFTVAQRNAAEAKTTDLQDDPTLGDVSYIP